MDMNIMLKNIPCWLCTKLFLNSLHNSVLKSTKQINYHFYSLLYLTPSLPCITLPHKNSSIEKYPSGATKILVVRSYFFRQTVSHTDLSQVISLVISFMLFCTLICTLYCTHNYIFF